MAETNPTGSNGYVISGYVFFRDMPVPNANVVFQNTQYQYTVLTNASGYFEKNVIAGIYNARVTKSGFFDTTAQLQVYANVYHEFVLTQFIAPPPITGSSNDIGYVSGKVKYIDIYGQLKYVNNANVYSSPYSTIKKTDSDGNYVIQLPAGNYTIIAQDINYVTNTVNNVVVRSNETTPVDIVLQPLIVNPGKGKITGTVYTRINDINRVVPNVAVTTLPYTTSSLTSTDGKFEISDVPIGTYSIKVTADGFFTATKNFVSVTSPNEEATANFMLVPSGSDFSIQTVNNENIYADVERLVMKNTPQLTTSNDYSIMLSAVNSIVDTNKSIVKKFEDILIGFIKYKRVSYDVTDLNSNSNFEVVVTSSIYNNTPFQYMGKCYYNSTKKMFITGKDQFDTLIHTQSMIVSGQPVNVSIPAQLPLIYKPTNEIYNLFTDSNFSFTSVLQESNDSLTTNTSKFLSSFNNVAISLNKKLNFTIGLHKGLVEYYTNFKDIITEHLFYRKNYTDLRKLLASVSVNESHTIENYEQFIQSLADYVEISQGTTRLIDDVLKIKPDSRYNSFTKIVTSKYPVTYITDPNYKIVKAFYNINTTLGNFIESFRKINSPNEEYTQHLLSAIDIKLIDIINETIDGFLEFETKLSDYFTDNVFNLSITNPLKKYSHLDETGLSVLRQYVYNTVAQQNLSESIKNLNNLISSLNVLKFLFDINQKYSVFVDYNIKNSATYRTILNVPFKNTYFLSSKLITPSLNDSFERLDESIDVPTINGLSMAQWRDNNTQRWTFSGMFYLSPSKVQSIRVTKFVTTADIGTRIKTVEYYTYDTWTQGSPTFAFSANGEMDWKERLVLNTTLYYTWVDRSGVQYNETKDFTHTTGGG